MLNINELKFDEKGLIPAVVVDADSQNPDNTVSGLCCLVTRRGHRTGAGKHQCYRKNQTDYSFHTDHSFLITG